MRAERWPSFLKSVNASLTSAADPLQPFFAFSGLEKRTLSPCARPRLYDQKSPKQTGISMVTRNYQGWPTTNYPAFEFPPWRTSTAKQIGQGSRNRTRTRYAAETGDRESQYAVNSRDHAWPSFDLFPCRFPTSILFMDYTYGGGGKGVPQLLASPRWYNRTECEFSPLLLFVVLAFIWE